MIKRKIISIDGTGINVIPPQTSSICEKRTAKSHKQKYQSIFLYTVNLIGHGNVPIAQMVSQRHTMSLLKYWMNIWCPSNKKPLEIMLDQSAALFGACVQAFTHVSSTIEYITACVNCLLTGTQPPSTFIRLDRFYFVRTIHNLKQFKNLDPLKVKLFKSVFGVLILCHDINATRRIIIDLFTVMRNRFVNEICKRSLLNLQNICNNHEVNLQANDADQTDDASFADDRESIVTWLRIRSEKSFRKNTSLAATARSNR